MGTRISRYFPHIIGLLLIGTIAAGSYYGVNATSPTSSPPKALWTTNPITISFSHTTGTASASDPFKCAPPFLTTVVLTTTVNKPLLVSLSVSPSIFPSCGPSFSPLTLTASSTVAGTYTGTVTVHQASQYGNTIPPSLTVNIVVN